MEHSRARFTNFLKQVDRKRREFDLDVKLLSLKALYQLGRQPEVTGNRITHSFKVATLVPEQQRLGFCDCEEFAPVLLEFLDDLVLDAVDLRLNSVFHFNLLSLIYDVPGLDKNLGCDDIRLGRLMNFELSQQFQSQRKIVLGAP